MGREGAMKVRTVRQIKQQQRHQRQQGIWPIESIDLTMFYDSLTLFNGNKMKNNFFFHERCIFPLLKLDIEQLEHRVCLSICVKCIFENVNNFSFVCCMKCLENTCSVASVYERYITDKTKNSNNPIQTPNQFQFPNLAQRVSLARRANNWVHRRIWAQTLRNAKLIIDFVSFQLAMNQLHLWMLAPQLKINHHIWRPHWQNYH